jgi:hypothetical protein
MTWSQCNRCFERKVLETDFAYSHTIKRGYQYTCKACINVDKLAWNKAHHERYEATRALYRARNRAAINAREKARRARIKAAKQANAHCLTDGAGSNETN